ncbi:CpaF family protein [Kallotenue papyrolyticum]|uniref:CpaF family protein n=1 Tax=Kallotenue papyrolyticum TaxID=1325125 RepID=UPI00047853D1|nr:CpaF family protein [Kallotenue papyrolyticum]
MPRFRLRPSNGQPAADDLSAVLPLASRRTPAPISTVTEEQRALVARVQERLLRQIEARFEAEVRDPERLQRHITNAVNAVLEEDNVVLPERERQRLQRMVRAEVIGLGPLEELLADDTITEIMVNGPHEVFIERGGVIYETDVRFNDDAHVRRIIDRIVAPLGRRVSESTPMVDARLPDGSRVNIVIPPIALNGPTITIRKFSQVPLTADDLVALGTMTPEVLEFLRACVVGRMNLIVSGGTGAGKTTLLNVLSSFIPDHERIITIENAAELQLQQRHVVALESRPPNIEGKNEITIRDLVINALRMRPNRIVVGECRGGEALDMLQAMNTGHDGSLTTIHANSPRDAIGRIETMVLMSGMDLPVRAIREQIASAINVIVHVERMTDGARRITRICEVTGMEGEVVTMSDLFVFRQEGVRDGRVLGRLLPTGIRPRLLEQLAYQGITLAPAIFGYAPPTR